LGYCSEVKIFAHLQIEKIYTAPVTFYSFNPSYQQTDRKQIFQERMTAHEYNRCVDDHADAVYRFILKNIKDEDKARDIVQDSFEKMWNKAAEIAYSKSKSYLFTTAYHTMIDSIRKEKNFTSMNDESFNMHSVNNSYSDLKEVLNEAVSKLPEIQRHVIMLRDYEGYSYQEIGEITGLNESQVKVYIYRARTFLKNYIGKLDLVV
jgi:RNA polymerase sigma factor (sigma-70 family)